MRLEAKFDDNGVPVIQSIVLKPFSLRSGRTCPEVRVGFCVFAESPDLPVIVLHPALTGSPRAWLAGKGSQGDGWFSANIGPGKLLDTQKYCIVCVDPIGGNGYSSGAEELLPFLDQLNFSDGIEATALLLQHFGLSEVEAVLGGSIGGGQAFEWLFQNQIKVKKIFDISGSACRTKIASEFFLIQSDLLDPFLQPGTDLIARLKENCRDLSGSSQALDLVLEHIIFNLRKVLEQYSTDAALRVARQIGFIRFVNPAFYQNRFDTYLEETGEVEYAKDKLLGWIEHQGNSFVPRFSASALRQLCIMDTRASLRPAELIAEALELKKIRLTGFSVAGDVLFPQPVQQNFYDLVKACLSKEDQQLVSLVSVTDEINGHDHFLTPHFAASARLLKQKLEEV